MWRCHRILPERSIIVKVYARALSAEGLLSLRPTLVVATEDAGPPAVLRQLEAAKVPLVGRKIERHAHTCLPLRQQIFETLVGFFRRSKTGELPHRP